MHHALPPCSNPSCRLLSTHDDYSLMTKLPETATSIVTNVRDPADRLMSAYEFMVELSARTLRPNSPNEQVTREGLIEARKRATDKRRTETRNVWPWSHLVPMMEDDLWERVGPTPVSHQHLHWCHHHRCHHHHHLHPWHHHQLHHHHHCDDVVDH